MNDLNQLFLNPTAEYRGKPFWSWNGKLNKEELLKQIENLKEMGMGGYFCHSRTGLITEYLGDEWFDLINACAQKGEEMGMETWLYDEDRWPSGTAGGMVTEDPEYGMKYIRLTIMDGSQFTYDHSALAVFAVKLDGWSFSGKRKLTGERPAEGETVLQFTVEAMEKDSFYNGNTYVDTMSRKATDRFIELTHEKYAQKCGDRLGKTIRGIFTDEPHRGSVMNGFSLLNGDPEFLTPYTDLLFDEFQKAYGYDLIDFLPELYLWKDGEKISPVKWQYMELLERLFLQNFLKPIHEFCQSKNMLFTGHLLHEDSLTTQGCMIGSIMRAYEYLDCPGVDVLTEHNRSFWIVKQLQSAARQLGKNTLLSELYGCTGWQFNFESHKSVGDWQALFGINLRCHHLSWVSMQGEAKRDYPASISHQSAWYREYSYIEDYFSRIHVMTGVGAPVCDVLVINPVESTFASIYPKWSSHLVTLDPQIGHVEGIYAETFHMLCESRIDFDYGDEDFIKRFGKTAMDGKTPVIRIGNGTYKTVLVPEMLTMRSTTLELLRQFAEMGGNVVFAGEIPPYIDAVKSDLAAKLPASYVPFEKEAVLQSLKVRPFVTVTGENGENIDNVYAQVRKDGDDYFLFLLNVDRQEAYRNTTVSIDGGGFCEKWNARNGERTLMTNGEKIRFVFDFEPDGELLLVLTPKDNHLPAEVSQKTQIEAFSLGNEFEYELNEPNVLVLDIVDYQVDNGEWARDTEILRADIEIRKKLGVEPRGGCMLQPWFTGKKEQPELCSLMLHYKFHIGAIPQQLSLAMETPEHFTVLVNGRAALSETDDFWVDSCYTIFNIDPSSLKTGENTIAVSTKFRTDINLEAMYLLGSFGVSLEGRKAVLGQLPVKLKTGDITRQGFPFYGAGVTYFAEIPECPEGGAMVLGMKEMNTACIKVTDGEKEQMIACKPYEADITGFGKKLQIQYILTRRNTFGPLHQYPLIAGAYGPESFTSEGDGFLYDSYGLLPQGMTDPVTCTVYQKNRG